MEKRDFSVEHKAWPPYKNRSKLLLLNSLTGINGTTKSHPECVWSENKSLTFHTKDKVSNRPNEEEEEASFQVQHNVH